MARKIIFTIALILAAPLANATWMAYGTHEPDSADDAEEFMPFEPTTEPGAQVVYFNGWAEVNNIGNPNVGLLGTRNEILAEEVFFAILGVWSDCNGDGYVGIAETAAREYESALLTDTSICPPRTNAPVQKWSGEHNYNKWVSEFIPIGGDGGDPSDDVLNKRVYRDVGARVWGDFGRPDDIVTGASLCPISPPHGSTQTTGGFLNFIDCVVDVMETTNVVVDALDASNSLGLRYANADEARQAGHPLHFETFGTEDADHSAAYASDCGAPPMARFHSGETLDSTGIEDTLGRELVPFGFALERRIWTPNPRLGDSPSPTAPATLNATLEESAGGCNYEDAGKDFYGPLETDAEATSLDKRSATFNFAFRDGARGGTEDNGNVGGNALFAILHGGAAGMTNDGGLNPPDWSANLVQAGSNSRTTRASEGQGAALPPARYFTYYATVGEAITAGGLALPGGSGVYGGTQCGSETSGIHGGWNCDAGAWYRDANGARIGASAAWALPGDAYFLRDVDCHDGGNGLGIPLGAPALGSSACIAP